MGQDNLVTIKTFLHRHEAEMAKGLLTDEGIQAIVSADDLGGLRLDLTLSRGGARLLVGQNDAQRAKEILEVLEKAGGEPISSEEAES